MSADLSLIAAVLVSGASERQIAALLEFDPESRDGRLAVARFLEACARRIRRELKLLDG